MTSRGEIERIIDETYAARRRNDPIGTLQHIADDFEFRIMGSHLLGPMGERITSRSALTAAMTDLCENWDFADVRQSAMWVEGDTAIVKRGGPIRHRPSGQKRPNRLRKKSRIIMNTDDGRHHGQLHCVLIPGATAGQFHCLVAAEPGGLDLSEWSGVEFVQVARRLGAPGFPLHDCPLLPPRTLVKLHAEC